MIAQKTVVNIYEIRRQLWQFSINSRFVSKDTILLFHPNKNIPL